MSIYYELRMTGVLSFKNKEDKLSLEIKKYFEALLNLDEKSRTRTPLVLKKSFILENNKIKDKYYGIVDFYCPEIYEIYLRNRYVYESDNESMLVKISQTEQDIFSVDFCIGNKNGFSILELITLLLIEYMQEGFTLVYYNEQTTRVLEIGKDSLTNYIKENTEDEFCGVMIFDCLKEIRNSVLQTSEEEHEKIWLREGLVYKIN